MVCQDTEHSTTSSLNEEEDPMYKIPVHEQQTSKPVNLSILRVKYD